MGKTRLVYAVVRRAKLGGGIGIASLPTLAWRTTMGSTPMPHRLNSAISMFERLIQGKDFLSRYI